MNFIDARLMKGEGGLCFLVDGQTVPVPPARAKALAGSLDREVKIGVRSHQMRPVEAHAAGAIRLKVQMVENLGKELLVQAQVGKNLIRISEEDTTKYAFYRGLADVKGEMGILLTDQINVFDSETKANVLMEQ